MGKPQKEIASFSDELAALRKALGDRIRELRKLRDWSQEEFADHAHIHRTFAGSLERGEKNVSFHALVLISRSFGITLSELLAGLEMGESLQPRRKSGTSMEMDRNRILWELAAAERNIQAAKEIASPLGKRPASDGRKRRKS